MPNELITTPSTWTPPQAKWVRRIVTGIAGFGLLAVVAFIVNKTVPSITSAVDLLTKLTGSLISLSLTAAGLAVVIWLLYQVFSPSGGINKLFAMQYASLINKMTWAMLDLDPLSPFYERQKEVRAYKARFEGAVGRVDGILARWRETVAKYTKEASLHERNAKSANAAKVTDARFANTFQIESRAYQRCTDTAAEFQSYIARVDPVRQQLHQAVEAADMVDQNLAMEVRIARDKWKATGDFEEVNKAGRALFRGTEKSALAAQAAELIDMKYADQLGLLENLATTTQPMLDMIELEKVGAGETLISKWQTDSTKLLTAPTSSSSTGEVSTTRSGGFRNLIN